MRQTTPLVLIVLGLAGCLEPVLRLPTMPVPVMNLPARYEFRRGQVVYHSDADVKPDHPLFAELATFPEHVCRTLELPVPERLVHVYLFKDRTAFEDYYHREFQDLPTRRALFVLSRDGVARQGEARIYAFWGERIQDDLQHELTHATLHATLTDLPLWLDEGLAMYFEAGAAAQGRHQRALEAIATQMQQGTWRPDFERMTKLTEIKQLHLADYHEAWAWVHFFLHDDDQQRKDVLASLHALRHASPAPTSWRPTANTAALEKHLRKLIEQRRGWPHI